MITNLMTTTSVQIIGRVKSSPRLHLDLLTFKILSVANLTENTKRNLNKLNY